MSEWKEKTLADYIEIKHGYAFKGSEFSTDPTDVVVVTPGNFSIGGGFKKDKLKYHKGYNIPESYVFQGGELIVTMTDLSPNGDTLGYSAVVPKDRYTYLHNQRIGLVNFKNPNLYSGYCYWLMRSKGYQDFVVSAATGTAIRHTSPRLIGQYSFLLPPINEQITIAEVLSSLDDKIDLLQRQNKTLEQMAEALFREWFMAETTSDNKVAPLREYARRVNVSVNPGNTPDQLFYHYSLPSYDEGRTPELQTGSEILSNKTSIATGHILISKLNPRTPRVWYIHEAAENSVCSTEFMVYEPKAKEWAEFIYLYLRSDETKDTLASAASGTSGSHQRVSPTDIDTLMLPTPDEVKINGFHATVSVWMKKIYSNTKEMSTLSKLRDILLPKLMSGTVRVLPYKLS